MTEIKPKTSIAIAETTQDSNSARLRMTLELMKQKPVHGAFESLMILKTAHAAEALDSDNI